MDQDDLIPHLFRTEFSKICSVLAKRFGMEHIELAEDIASETFLLALETWTYKGIPPNPVAWLYNVAKNKTRNHLQRDAVFARKVAAALKTLPGETEMPEIDLSDKNTTDSRLQLLFAICHPVIPANAQIGLALRILCGFGIDEIANAFLTNREVINKRLFRAKEKLRREKIKIEFPSAAEAEKRLSAVLTTLYLLFSEGYYSESHDPVLREELCLEAMRLVYLLLENEHTRQPQVHALLSLMCFHASRFPARKNAAGELVLYHDQDENLWNQELIARGAAQLKKAAVGDSYSRYHLEAGIAYWHTRKQDTQEKWEAILQLYNKLLMLDYSPLAALNRTYALSKVKGKAAAIPEAVKLQLTGNHYYFSLLGELYSGVDNEQAKKHFEKAVTLARTATDKKLLASKINAL